MNKSFLTEINLFLLHRRIHDIEFIDKMLHYEFEFLLNYFDIQSTSDYPGLD